MKKNSILIALAAVIFFASCKKILSPADENNRDISSIYNDAAFAEGLLLNGYVRLPMQNYSFNDVATDDAVSNNPTNSFLLMATGQWSSQNNPMDQWANSFAAIQYLNLILSQANNVNWATTGQYTKQMFNDRVKGESYGLRGLFMYYLLQAHGGWSADGKLLGAPIMTSVIDAQTNFKVPRNTFQECLTQIYKDLDSAESYLPLDFEDVGNGGIPAKYASLTTIGDYNRVFGAYNRGRLTSRIVKGIRAKVSLLGASPAFSTGTTVTWAKAADDAGISLDLIGGIAGMASNGHYWYAKTNAAEIDGLSLGTNPKEMLWRGNVNSVNNLESDNYPPSLYGKGRVNPTQNLVDAFPMANGLPITNTTSGYDATNPYRNRDPRLTLYTVVNGSAIGPFGAVINTNVGAPNNGLNSIATSTRTGYYLRKLLRTDINLDPVNTTTSKHYVAFIRYTELFLSYAEAANEAYGPDGKGTHTYSARDVIAAIRKRAGITQPDSYLASITSKDDMRTLIHNERRLELCFEGFRFWDLRRWKESITNPANGVSISNNQYTISTVENRSYPGYTNYGPLPYSEVLKWGFVQNQGW